MVCVCIYVTYTGNEMKIKWHYSRYGEYEVSQEDIDVYKELDPQFRLTPSDYIKSCISEDERLFDTENLAIMRSYDEIFQ